MREFCEDGMPQTPGVADVPGMDVEMFLEPWVDIDSGKRGIDLVVANVTTGDEARFKVAYCPMCGRKLAERGQ